LFYNGPLVRFERLELNEKLTFLLSFSISYKDVVGIRAGPFRHIYSKFGADCMPNAFSVMNIAVTSDNKIPLGLRCSGDWEEGFEISGGFVGREEIHDVFKSSLNRLKDDFSILPNQISGQKLIAVYEYPSITETTACFLINLKISSEGMKGNYGKVIFAENSFSGIEGLKGIEKEMHEPSFSALQYYKERVK
jgi:hypothetical protein